MGSEEETSGISSMPSESDAINFQATTATPDSERKVRTECVPPPLPHSHSTPATVPVESAAATPLKRSSTAPHKLEACEPLQHSPKPTPSSGPTSTSPSPSSSPPGVACGGPLSDGDLSDAIENNASDGGELDRPESSSNIPGSVKYSRDSHRVEFEIQGPISEAVVADLAKSLAHMANTVTVDEKPPQAQKPSNLETNEQQKPPDKISSITYNKNTSMK